MLRHVKGLLGPCQRISLLLRYSKTHVETITTRLGTLTKGRRRIGCTSDAGSDTITACEHPIARVLLVTEVLQLNVLRRALVASSTRRRRLTAASDNDVNIRSVRSCLIDTILFVG